MKMAPQDSYFDDEDDTWYVYPAATYFLDLPALLLLLLLPLLLQIPRTVLDKTANNTHPALSALRSSTFQTEISDHVPAGTRYVSVLKFHDSFIPD